jgi:pyruvate dehydrogenase E2 component (dihydrolipoamide acetyltransferase)
MATDVRVPTTGNAGEDAVVIEWNVQVGSTVAAGDVLVVLETAKATMDVEAPVAGEVLSIRFASGDEVPEHEVIAVLGAPGESVAEPAPAEPAASAAPVATAPTPDAAPAPPAREAGARIAVSPRARLLAERRGIDLAGLAGSGPAGRIIVWDVLSAPADDAPAPAPAATAPARTERGSTVVPVRGARKITAQRMHDSLQTTAQVTLTRYAGADALLAYNARLKSVTEQRGLPKIGVNDLLLFAVARTLAQHPEANSWFSWDGITQFDAVDLGFAVDTGQALLVPVIRDADTLSVSQIAAAAQGLIGRARSGGLGTADMEGGTFTVSNLGGLGVHWFTPVLNPPQSGILGVGATHQLHPEGPRLLPLSLTFDHRAIDGAAAAGLLADIAGAIETIDVLAAL